MEGNETFPHFFRITCTFDFCKYNNNYEIITI